MKILLYVEPHPIRDSFEEFSGIGKFLAEALLAYRSAEKYDLRIFSNDAVSDLLNLAIPTVGLISERPTGAESATIGSFKSAWREDTIQKWVDLTNGSGPITDFYYSILARLYSKFSFDAVLLWSENGAVRKFCKDHGLLAIHGELGPTRLPFEETIYFDPEGTNGNAAAARACLADIPVRDLPAATWLGTRSRLENNPEGIGLVDTPYTVVPDDLSNLVQTPYIYIPLQLADDLNTIKNSDFSGPSDFLKRVLPTFLSQGYNIVIKPHPGSIYRPFNLIEETKAINYAKSLGSGVLVLERSTTVTRALRLIAQANYVCTINSSVGYEALLLGKTPLVLGDAFYDIGGVLKKSCNQISDLSKLNFDKQKINKLINFVSGHLLISKELVATGEPIVRIISSLLKKRETAHSNYDSLYWNEWVAKIRYGVDWVRAKSTALQTDHLESREIFGNLALMSATKRNVTIDAQKLTMVAENQQGAAIEKGEALIAPKHFVGHIDLVQKTDASKKVKITGWAVDGDFRAPAAVLILEGDKVVSIHRVLVQRQDTCDFLKTNFKKAADMSIHPTCGFSFETTVENIQTSRILLLSSDNIVSISRLTTGLFQPST